MRQKKMRLKKLDLSGFKSFADRTVLRFDHGITVIVGPNGCGKSNVSDGFRWVLGEQSARSLRGHKMPDVIFAGTTDRKPLNTAEVSITLEDVPGKFPAVFDSVTITRRLHRSGESDYLINDEPSRLKDVQELLLDSGVGNDAYAIFEQGKIDEVIRLSAMERRYIFEEAAGIKRFLQRKKEALRKLEQTKNNVERIRDLHREIERQVVVLERQAEEAKTYQERKGELDALEKALLEEKWREWNKKRAYLQHKIDAAEQAFADLNQKNEVLDGALKEMKQQLAEIEKTLRLRSECVFQCRSTKEIHGKDQEGSLLRLQELQEREKQLEVDIEQLQLKRDLGQKEKVEIKASLASLEKKRQIVETDLEKHNTTLQTQDDVLKKVRLDYQQKQKSLLEATQKHQVAQGEFKQLEIRIENSLEREKYLHSRKAILQEQQHAAEKIAQDSQKTFEQLLQALEEKRTIMNSLESQLSDNMAEMEVHETRFETINRLLADSKARFKALKALQDEMEGFSSGSQKLLKESATTSSPLHKKLDPLYSSFNPKKGAEKAIAAVMAPYAQTLVVQTIADFTLVTKFAASHKITDFSLICLELIDITQKKKRATKADSDFLSNYVTGNPLTEHFLGRTSLSEKVNSAAIQQNSCLFDGWYTDERLVVFFPKSEPNGVYVRVAEIKELELLIVSQEQEQKQLEAVLKELQLKRKQLQEEMIITDKAIRQLEIKSAEMNVSLQRSKGDRERVLADHRKVDGEIGATQADLVTLNGLKNACAEVFSTAQKRAATVQREVDLVAARVEELVIELKSELEVAKQIEIAHQLLLNEKQKLSNALTIIDVKYEESQQQTKRFREEIVSGRALQVQMTKKCEELKRLLVADEKALNEALKAKAVLEEDFLVLQKKMHLLQAKSDQSGADWKKQQDYRHQLNIQSAQIMTQVQALSDELFEKHGVDAVTIGDEEAPKGSVQLETRIKQLRKELEASRAVNMLSIEEHAQCRERHQSIHVQLEDMEVAEKELIAIIMELDEESRLIFRETFAKIRENFQKNFSILFSGGEADLLFVDSSDVLEAGIEIVAKPPGKQMRSIQLLSGGEKCLTALALLFAIFEVKPSPFCILDEIDAPLDDANVDRFIKIVKQFSEVCQFIVITHNKRTMTVADRIFGVTMEEKGISKLLTLELETKESTQTSDLQYV